MAIITVESVSKEMVKPIAKRRQRDPNDVVDHPKTHTLCLFDQLANQTYVTVIFFYRRSSSSSSSSAADTLKASLAAALHDFYPLAGRIRAARGSTVVDCTDQGALFLEARALGGSLSEFVGECVSADELSLLKPLVPDGFGTGDSYCPAGEGGGGGVIPLAVQATSFRCGGAAVCASFAHSVVDMGGISHFVRTWAAHAAGGGESSSLPVLPEFNLSALYPPVDDAPMEMYVPAKAKRATHARIFIESPMLEALKQEARSEQVENPSSVEAVTALIHLTAIKAAAAAAASDSNRTKNLMQTMNLRGRVTPPLPANTTGNLVGSYSVVGPAAEEATLAGLVSEIRREKGKVLSRVRDADRDQLRSEALEQMRALKARVSSARRRGDEVAAASESGRVAELMMVTSWVGFGLYEMDFGWGNPDWVVRGPWEKVNGAGLIDRPRGAAGRMIEIGLMLEEEEMRLFLCDEKLRSFGRINPNPLEIGS